MNRQELIAIRLNLIERNFHPEARPTIVAVSKRQPFSDIECAYMAGIRDFGENRVEELVEKAQLAHERGMDDIRWHFIGNLQTKKINKLLRAPRLVAIHSVDSFELLQSIGEREEHFVGEKCDILLQVNTSNEAEKSGFINWDNLAAAVNLLLKRKEGPFHLHGLMTMSKLRTNNFEEDAFKCFEQLDKIRKSLIQDFDLEDLKLSMGMSNDYLIALQVGTDYLRLGGALFAPDANND